MQSQVTTLTDELSEAIDESLALASATPTEVAVLARLARVRGTFVRLDRAIIEHEAEIVLAHTPPPPATLPKLQPLAIANGKPTRRVGIKLKSPKDFVCPSCQAEVGTPCFKSDRIGRGAKPTTERHPENSNVYHTARSALSKDANDRAKAKYDKEHAS